MLFDWFSAAACADADFWHTIFKAESVPFTLLVSGHERHKALRVLTRHGEYIPSVGYAARGPNTVYFSFQRRPVVHKTMKLRCATKMDQDKRKSESTIISLYLFV